MAPTSPPRHPLGPLDFAVTAVGGLVATVLVVFSALAAFGGGTIGAVGADEVCATTRPGVVPSGSSAADAGVRDLRPNAFAYTETVAVCVEDPPAWVIASGALRVAADLVFPLVALIFAGRLVRHARRSRLFSLGVAARTRHLGWLLGAGGLLAATLAAVSDGLVLRHAIAGQSWTSGLVTADFPWLLLIVAFGVITVGRVLEWAVVMQEEVDATV